MRSIHLHATGGSDARKLKGLEEENAQLNKLLAESMLDVSRLREMLAKNS